MKKLIFLLLVLTSCGYAPIDNSKPIIITGIEEWKDGYCNYYSRGNYKMVLTFTETNFKFRDECGKYNIGDTVYLVNFRK